MKKAIFCMGIGAGLMYFFDPELGWVRRGLLMDRMRGKLPQTTEAISTKADAVVAKAGEVAEQADNVAAQTIGSLGSDVLSSPEENGNAMSAPENSNSDTASGGSTSQA
jgi:hypothetical protein